MSTCLTFLICFLSSEMSTVPLTTETSSKSSRDKSARGFDFAMSSMTCVSSRICLSGSNCKRERTSSVFPRTIARNKGEWPFLFLCSVSAPYRKRISRQPTFPLLAHMLIGWSPFASASWMESGKASRINSMHDPCPFWHAQCNGVLSNLVDLINLAPLSSKNCVQSALPFAFCHTRLKGPFGVKQH